MGKTYTARLADRIREILPDDTEFEVMADPQYWKGYVFVIHPNGADTFIMPWVSDKRAAVTDDAVQATLRSVAYKLRPRAYYTETWQALNQEAHDSWVAQTGIEL